MFEPCIQGSLDGKCDRGLVLVDNASCFDPVKPVSDIGQFVLGDHVCNCFYKSTLTILLAMPVRFYVQDSRIREVFEKAVRLVDKVGVVDSCDVVVYDYPEVLMSVSGLADGLLFRRETPPECVTIIEPRKAYFVYLSTTELTYAMHAVGHLVIDYLSGVESVTFDCRGLDPFKREIDMVAVWFLQNLLQDVIVDVYVSKHVYDRYRDHLRRVLEDARSSMCIFTSSTVGRAVWVAVSRASAKIYRMLLERRLDPVLAQVWEKVDSIKNTYDLAELMDLVYRNEVLPEIEKEIRQFGIRIVNARVGVEYDQIVNIRLIMKMPHEP